VLKTKLKRAKYSNEDIDLYKSYVKRQEFRLKKQLDKFRVLLNKKNSQNLEQVTLNQIYEIRFEISELWKDNKQIKRMMHQLIRSKTEGKTIQELQEEDYEDSDIDIHDSVHLSQRSSLKKIVEARKRRQTLLRVSRESRSVLSPSRMIEYSSS